MGKEFSFLDLGVLPSFTKELCRSNDSNSNITFEVVCYFQSYLFISIKGKWYLQKLLEGIFERYHCKQSEKNEEEDETSFLLYVLP